jgi:flagellar biosynthesis/type III secretory pathway protein FliH
MTTNSVPMHAPLVGIRLHSRRPTAASGAAPAPAQRLLDLHELQRRREAAVAALRDFATAARRTVDALPQQVTERLDEVAGLAVELGLALANEIVGDALQKGLVDPTPTVIRCLRDCVHGSSKADLVVRLHPDDLALVQQTLQAHPEVREETAAARFVADPTIARGGVRAETGAGRLQYDPREVLQRICDEVRREATA